MRWRALQVGQIYIRQHPDNAQLTVVLPTECFTMLQVFMERNNIGLDNGADSSP